MKEQLQQIVETINPKNHAAAIKRHPELYQWVQTFHGETLSEKVFNALYPNQNICKLGNNKKFNSITTGYRFCGKPSVCACAKASVIKSVKESKKLITPEEQKRINELRAATNMAKYGVTNTGQTQTAIERHKEFYQDKEKVQEVTERIKKTTLERYNVENATQLPEIQQKIAQTNLKKYGETNPLKVPSIAAQAIQTKKERYEPFHIAKLNHKKFIQMCEENFNVTPQVTREEYIGIATSPLMNFQCLSCSGVFSKRFSHGAPPICKICNPTDISYKSKEELSLYEFCKTITPTVLSGDRTQIAPYEIDIYLPDYKIGIEYCGLYWHSEVSGKKSWNYHWRKHQAAESKGIQLITIFSDEWLNSPEVVKSIILNKTNAQTTTVFARKCTVGRVDSRTAFGFYEKYHLQDVLVEMPINYGLFQNGLLCAVMSFVKKEEGAYELSRFASAGRVIGGASKLLNAFIREYTPEQITSFSNNRYSNGGLYKTLGFEIAGTVPPMQEYVFKYSSRVHKLGIGKFIKDVKEGKTEWEAAREIGCDRIWDCGKVKWVLKLNQSNE